MNKNLRILPLLLCLVLILVSASPDCFAVNNAIIGSGSAALTPSQYGCPGPADIRATSNSGKVTYPNSNSYFSDYVTYYIDAPKKEGVKAYYMPSANAENPRVVYHGARVIGIAEQAGFTCILYYDLNMEYRTGWVVSSNLSSYFPGRTVDIYTGYTSSLPGTAYYYGDPVLSKSRDSFVGRQEKYYLLDTPVYDVYRFTVDYHVVARGDSRSSGGWKGPRTIYINDGSGWLAVGSFEYEDTAVVHANVIMDSPVTIAAVAVIADCAMPAAFTARVALLDLIAD